jgi:hypothetical protein
MRCSLQHGALPIFAAVGLLGHKAFQHDFGTRVCPHALCRCVRLSHGDTRAAKQQRRRQQQRHAQRMARPPDDAE